MAEATQAGPQASRPTARPRSTPDIDIAVIGAGPYGLSVAAHLRGSGHEVRVFGEPLHFWHTQTPRGMLLRSPYSGSNIGDPEGKLGLPEYERATAPVTRPIPVDRFLDYGLWFQQRVVPDLDARDVRRLTRRAGGFRLDVGRDVFTARRVVVAAGVGTFARFPAQLADLDRSLLSHSLDYGDLGAHAGKSVLVVGGGQSALESAALLSEAGADVQVTVRAPIVRWLRESSRLHTTKYVSSLLYAWPDVGPMLVSHLVAHPEVYSRMPRRTQDRLAVRSVRPAGAGWLRPRLDDVPIRLGGVVRAVESEGGRVRVDFADGSRTVVDHVLAATGYRVDLARYAFLDRDLVRQIDCRNGYPLLNAGFETSVRGLHIVGAPAARQFGPLMRFVAGSDFAGRSVARGLPR